MANTNQIVLRALKYDKEFLPSDEDVNSKKFRQLVSWIEDAKVSAYVRQGVLHLDWNGMQSCGYSKY